MMGHFFTHPSMGRGGGGGGDRGRARGTRQVQRCERDVTRPGSNCQCREPGTPGRDRGKI